MATPAQILANHSNARHSTGPVTPEGKAAVSQNAAKLGLFSAASFVRPAEREEFDRFNSGYLAELYPQTPLEETLAREIVHAAWRLRRCAELETNPPEAATPEELDRVQVSVDRARATAQRSLHRSLAELRRVQTERVYRAIALPEAFHPENPGQASCRQLDPPALFIQQVKAADAQLMNELIDSAKQTQSRPAPQTNVPRNAAGSFAEKGGTGFQPVHDGRADNESPKNPIPAYPDVPRNAPCPCGSREKYKRCCGKTAPPVLR